MATDLKTLTPGTAAASSVVVGATSAAAASPSLFTTTGSGNVVLSASPTLTGNTVVSSGSLQINSGTVMTDTTPALDISQTWNGVGVAFTGLKFAVTNTNSATSSLLIDLRYAGNSVFSVRRDGYIANTLGSTGILLGNSANKIGLVLDATNSNFHLNYGVTAASRWVTIANNMRFGFGSDAADASVGPDTVFTRAAAATWQMGAQDAAGASATVTASAAADTITWTSHGLQTGSGVRFTNSGGALPGGITTSITYYAVVVDANTIKIATTYDNATAASPTIVNITSDGTGTTTGYGAKTQQSLKVQSFTGTDIPGSPLVIKGSQGTGTGAGGSIIFQVAPEGTTGTAQNAYADAFAIASTQTFSFGSASSTNTTIRFGGANYYMTATRGNTSLNFGVGDNRLQIDAFPGITMAGRGYYAWSDGSITNTATTDVYLYRDASNTLALRNGANAQQFNVYNTWTSFGTGTEVWERFRIFAQSGGSVILGTQKGADGGTARALELQTDGTTRLAITTAGLVNVGSPSALMATATYGVAVARSSNLLTRIVSEFTGTDSTSGGGVFIAATNSGSSTTTGSRLGLFLFSGNTNGTLNNSSGVQSFASENWSATAAGSRFEFATTANTTTTRTTRLIIGNSGIITFGATEANTVPALKPSSATLQVRLADDSGYTTIDAQLRSQGTAPATTGATGTAGDIRYDSGYIYVCTATDTWKRVAIATW